MDEQSKGQGNIVQRVLSWCGFAARELVATLADAGAEGDLGGHLAAWFRVVRGATGEVLEVTGAGRAVLGETLSTAIPKSGAVRFGTAVPVER